MVQARSLSVIPVNVFLWFMVMEKADFSSYGMSVGDNSASTGYLWLASSIMSVMKGMPSLSDTSADKGIHRRPPASVLSVVRCSGVMCSAATIMSVSFSRLSSSNIRTISPFLNASIALSIILSLYLK